MLSSSSNVPYQIFDKYIDKKTVYCLLYDHPYHADQDSLTWTSDWDKTSDFDDVSGHWHLEAHPEKPDCSCDFKLRRAIPNPVVNYLSTAGWVKKESEVQSTLTLNSKRQLTTQVAAKDGDARVTISVLQVIEAPKLA